MKLIIANDEQNIVVAKDYTDLTDNRGLIGQVLVELELIKKELLLIYLGDLEEKE